MYQYCYPLSKVYRVRVLYPKGDPHAVMHPGQPTHFDVGAYTYEDVAKALRKYAPQSNDYVLSLPAEVSSRAPAGLSVSTFTF